MRYSAKPGNPSKSSIRQIKLYSVAVKTAVMATFMVWKQTCNVSKILRLTSLSAILSN